MKGDIADMTFVAEWKGSWHCGDPPTPNAKALAMQRFWRVKKKGLPSSTPPTRTKAQHPLPQWVRLRARPNSSMPPTPDPSAYLQVSWVVFTVPAAWFLETILFTSVRKVKELSIQLGESEDRDSLEPGQGSS